ncbi:MAG: hypothetical protein A3F35_02900 [Candidatus Woykebacteria bacterium RIFCSPHIGHO2_12_FULL_45_10]|uniref:LiaI-LiaF-like transmembrane region domain-containing protein n=1 Tax=Candidatus Woykebacteria bacterium RIFCSPHIGHO2_12_FULL_45_10 TaxID=1802603 RepID=A0A1G1WPC3_9BACT|nr:MAG: hypothetical protein A3F35_02900 [Candidatus Woykebacteria bacterium RIFCSPHIGHO2_12_FULL_45_10]
MRNRGNRSSLAPFILVFLGSIFLLNNFGVLPWSIWLSLWKFWPVLLILIGVELLVGRTASFRTILILAVLIFIVPILLFLNPFGGNPLTTTKVKVDEPLSTTVRSRINIDLPTINLKIKPLATDSAKLVSGEAFYDATGGGSIYSKADDKNTAFLTFKLTNSEQIPLLGSFRNSLDLALSRLIPLDVSIKSGASNLNLDLGNLNISNLDIQSGAGNIFIKYSSQISGKTFIKTGASSINLEVPKDLPSRIKITGGPKKIDILPERFVEAGGVYQSKSYSTSVQSKLEIEIEIGAGAISVR